MINEKTFELLEQLASIPEGKGSRTAKLEILKENKEFLQEYFDIAVNPYRVFRIAQIPDTSTVEINPKILVREFVNFLENQKGITKENRELTRSFLNLFEPIAAKWLKAAILKNVKLGIDIKTLNKVGYNLPSFELLLASVNKENSLEGTKYPAIVQPKLDGCRAVYFPDKGVFMGRNGREVENAQIYNHIQIPNKDYVLDGEFYSFKRKFNEIVGYFTAEDRELPEDIKFVVFNAIPIKDWYNQKTELSYGEQLGIINNIASESKNLERIRYAIANTDEEVRFFYQKFLDQGFEGAMVRNMDTTYAWERVKVKDGVLTKIKPFDYADCTILDAYEGEGKYVGKLGGFVVDYNGVKVDIGGGYTDAMREDFWKNKDQMIGKPCRVKYSEITEDKSLRFPVWDSLRESK